MLERRLPVTALFFALAIGASNGRAAAEETSAAPAVCSGVPGDPVNPSTSATVAATHGPGIADAAPVQLAATADHTLRFAPRSIPMLHAYDDKGGFAADLTHTVPALKGKLLQRALQRGFWGEMSGGGYYSVPWFGSCDQTQLLGSDFVFRAPAGGVLLVQYRTRDCRACDRLDKAIGQAIAAHPDVPYRWVQFDMGSLPTPSRWCHDELEFHLRTDLLSTKGFACPR